MIDVRQGDNRAKLRQMIADGEFVDSVVCDPPYGLVSVTKRFGGDGAAPAKFGTDGAFARQSRGFMGKLWDGTGIERDPEFWRLVWQVMKPGAYIIAFSSSRTYGYMQVAMETAGFITHPMFGWVFNTGFPKGHDVGRAIDATLISGGSSTVQMRRTAMGDHYEESVSKGSFRNGTETAMNSVRSTGPDTPLRTDEARQWQGWKTGTQSLKPALEPVYFGQKPFSEKTGAANVLKHGVGAVNIDACRVPGGSTVRMKNGGANDFPHEDDSWEPRAVQVGSDLGRYPANVIHDSSDEVVALFPQSGGQQAASLADGSPHGNSVYGAMTNAGPVHEPRNDTGSAARFFNSFPHDGPILCYPKAGKADRAGSKHATVKPIALMQHFIRLVTPLGGTVLDPFGGSGTTGQAALNEGMRCILMEMEPEYARDCRRRFDQPETIGDKLLRLSEAL